MIIGVPKEIKNLENRVALTPDNVKVLVDDGHTVLVQSQAGVGSNFNDQAYEEAGAKIETSPADVWKAQMVVKVKEPQEEEYDYFYDGLILFTYLHLANEEKLTKVLADKGVTAIAYETMVKNGKLPLLTPMSEVAGKMAVQAGTKFLEKINGGKGVLIGAVPTVKRSKVGIIGGGVVGENAAKVAHGMGASVTILDLNPERLSELDNIFNGQVETLISNPTTIANTVKESDLIITGVLVPGAKAPVLITEEMVKSMDEGSVIVDIAIDQGGNVETSTHPTLHSDPVYIKHGVIHYAVANIPGAVPRTSTIALTNSTLQYARHLANDGIQAAKEDQTIYTGVNVYQGKVTNEAVAHAFDLEYTELNRLLD
ncbi:Alanine dehydrogenase 2 [Alloiococcus otitis]|uniref:Alanine dehydrogenase n=1 Tax=Alloiococcus otitis ATCC 51267 TaxID=883081 RepID=K9EB07_9LACT|nr:alanine dehydrogenase [Alloiococcus otitis]EKU94404.1 alanine dehydrogenase [Alloiococcus otitis ATCC 51267]SUU81266.1 Alanine dehydrogenase 2 [Alloiococcus otitis]